MMKPEDIEKTAFTTKFGQFEYLVMPTRACNVPATFQSLMNSIFQEYMDASGMEHIYNFFIFRTRKVIWNV